MGEMPKNPNPQQQNKLTERKMDAKFAGWSVRRRMLEACLLVEQKKWTQAEAAEFCGVSRTRLNVNLGKRANPPDKPEKPVVVEVKNEKRRIPPFWEFDRLYFGGLICPDCEVHHETPKLHFEISDMIRDKT